MLAAFVRPDDPEVERILSRARHLIGERKGDPARVREAVRAIQDAVLDVAIQSDPTPHHVSAQRIRTPTEMKGDGTGTDLEGALLLAAVLERASLDPIVLLHEDRVATGVWLEDETFIDPAIDEWGRIQKRVERGALLLLDDDTPASTFLYAVDVAAARRSGIRPLPARGVGEEALREEEEVPLPERSPLPRVERWKRNLLDLTLRNRLLNYRPTRKSVALHVPDVAALERMLFDGKSLGILPESETPTPADEDEAFGRGRLRSVLADTDLERRLTHIYRDARSSLQEGGANTLYLAVGFLVWTETPTSTVERRAPVLLYPLTMTRRSLAEGTRGYRLELAEDDPQVNVSLLQKLEADYDLRVEGLVAPSAEEGAAGAAELLDRLRQAIRSNARWHVTDDVTLGLFSFTKFLMWVDLDRRRDVLTRNDVVRHLLDTPEAAFVAEAPFPDPSTFDADRPVADTFLPLDADSSQQGAIFAAAEGKTFVLEGPPGTGKSQTIANLICHALASGKRVLFVSQKMAALDVVMRRLQRIGLGPFCLELHSNKARKRLVLEQLREALEVAGTPSPDGWPGVAEELEASRDQVNATRDALHRVRHLGVNVHHALGRLVALADAPSVRLELGEPDALDAEGRRARQADVEAATTLLDEVGDVRDHPWRASRLTSWRPSVATQVDALAPLLREQAEALEGAGASLAATLALDPTACSRADIEALRDAAALFARTPAPRPGCWRARPSMRTPRAWSAGSSACDGSTSIARRFCRPGTRVCSDSTWLGSAASSSGASAPRGRSPGGEAARRSGPCERCVGRATSRRRGPCTARSSGPWTGSGGKTSSRPAPPRPKRSWAPAGGVGTRTPMRWSRTSRGCARGAACARGSPIEPWAPRRRTTPTGSVSQRSGTRIRPSRAPSPRSTPRGPRRTRPFS